MPSSVNPALSSRLNLPDDFEPVWEIASLFPAQGAWSEGDYLALGTNHLVELVDGKVEVLPMPTEEHQSIVLCLLDALRAFVVPRQLGKVLFSGMRVRLRPELFREPDVVFLATARQSLRGNQYWSGADLVIEVVSPDDPERDYVHKRRDYANAGISEYWIVDPKKSQIIVLRLSSDSYVEHGVFTRGDVARSALLESFEVDVNAVFDAARS